MLSRIVCISESLLFRPESECKGRAFFWTTKQITSFFYPKTHFFHYFLHFCSIYKHSVAFLQRTHSFGTYFFAISSPLEKQKIGWIEVKNNGICIRLCYFLPILIAIYRPSGTIRLYRLDIKWWSNAYFCWIFTALMQIYPTKGKTELQQYILSPYIYSANTYK